jgi:flagellar assembly factor FliW
MKTLEIVETQKCGSTGPTRIQLPYGLLGFEQMKNYALISNPAEEPFQWFQMLEESRQSFLVISPFIVVPDYSPDIAQEDVAFLELHSPEDALLINIVTIRGEGQATVNLKGPIVINRRTLVGKQVIPNNASQFSLRHPLPVS